MRCNRFSLLVRDVRLFALLLCLMMHIRHRSDFYDCERAPHLRKPCLVCDAPAGCIKQARRLAMKRKEG